MQLKIEKISSEGVGYGLHRDKKVFVPYSVVGDLLECRITKENSRIIWAEIIKILEASPQRQKPWCPYFGTCGGCNMQQMSGEAYLDFKKNLMFDVVCDVVCDMFIHNFVSIGPNSRRRATFQAGRDGSFGFFKRSTREVINIDTCPLLVPEINKLITPISSISRKIRKIKSAHVTAFDNGVGLGLGLRENLTIGEIETIKDAAEKNNIIAVSTTLNSNSPELLFQFKGPELNITDGRNLEVSNNIFLQATKKGQETIVKLVVSLLDECKNIVDLYAGIGLYSFELSKYAKVEAFEGIAEMVDIFNQNAKKMELSNQIKASVRDLVNSPLLPSELNRFDGCVINPPRTGGENQIASIGKSKIRHVALVSCCPKAFGRESKILTDSGFRLLKVVGIDQFYMTNHLEIVGLFGRNDGIN